MNLRSLFSPFLAALFSALVSAPLSSPFSALFSSLSAVAVFTSLPRPAFAADAVRVVEQEWMDAARNRGVPVRFYLPDGGNHSAPLPLILFSHGLGGSRAGGEQWGRLWAANGFISVHLQHQGSDEALWKDKNPLQGFANLRRAMTVENGVLRAQDAAFAIDEISRRKQAGDAVLARADLERIGMSGHSFGARTVVAVTSGAANQSGSSLGGNLVGNLGGKSGEKRIRAAIAFSPAPETSEALNRERFGGIAIPFLNLTGTADHLPLINDVSAEDRRIPYQFMHAPDKYLLVLAGADHMVFNGQPAERKWSEQNRSVHAPLIERVTLTFWNAYLKGDAGAKAELRGGAFKAALGGSGEWFVK